MKQVIDSIEDASGRHCIDIAQQAGGGFTLKAFRKDPEDEGKWTLVADYSATVYATAAEAKEAACHIAPWMREALQQRC